MNAKKCDRRRKIVGGARLFVQIASLTSSLVGGFALTNLMGLPMWAFIALVAVAGMFFCGWICPFGTVQELLRRAGRVVAPSPVAIPPSINRYLLLTRYVLYGLGMLLVLNFLDARRNFYGVVEGNAVTGAAYVVLGGMLFLSPFMDRPYCKYVCGFGAKFSLFGILRPLAIHRDKDRCVNCGRCGKACAMGVEVAKAHNVRDPHCIDCGECLCACPVPGALKLKLALPCKGDLVALRDKYLPKKDGGVAGAKTASAGLVDDKPRTV